MSVSEAYAEAVQVIGSKIAERPLPPGLNTAEVGDWTLTLNASKEEHTHGGSAIPPWNVLAANNKYLIFAVIAPDGGMIGGMPEADFIEAMRALNSARDGSPPQKDQTP